VRVGRGGYQAAGTTLRPAPTEKFDLGTSPVVARFPERTMDDEPWLPWARNEPPQARKTTRATRCSELRGEPPRDITCSRFPT